MMKEANHLNAEHLVGVPALGVTIMLAGPKSADYYDVTLCILNQLTDIIIFQAAISGAEMYISKAAV